MQRVYTLKAKKCERDDKHPSLESLLPLSPGRCEKVKQPTVGYPFGYVLVQQPLSIS